MTSAVAASVAALRSVLSAIVLAWRATSVGAGLGHGVVDLVAVVERLTAKAIGGLAPPALADELVLELDRLADPDLGRPRGRRR